MTSHSRLNSQTVIHFIATFSKVILCMYLNCILQISFIFQGKIKFIAKSTESCEKAKEWLQAHAYPAVRVLCVATTETLYSAPVLCTELIIGTKFYAALLMV